jgi:hypothetical protein
VLGHPHRYGRVRCRPVLSEARRGTSRREWSAPPVEDPAAGSGPAMAKPAARRVRLRSVLPGRRGVAWAAHQSLIGDRRGLRAVWTFLGPARRREPREVSFRASLERAVSISRSGSSAPPWCRMSFTSSTAPPATEHRSQQSFQCRPCDFAEYEPTIAPAREALRWPADRPLWSWQAQPADSAGRDAARTRQDILKGKGDEARSRVRQRWFLPGGANGFYLQARSSGPLCQ